MLNDEERSGPSVVIHPPVEVEHVAGVAERESTDVSPHARDRRLFDLRVAWDAIPDGESIVDTGLASWLQPLINAVNALVVDEALPPMAAECALCGKRREQVHFLVANIVTGNSVCDACAHRAAALCVAEHNTKHQLMVVCIDEQGPRDRGWQLESFRKQYKVAKIDGNLMTADRIARRCMAELGVDIRP